ncbi:hypothetical protein [Nocardia sp. NPDC058633]|jgi:hypothetical protein|uniref:hypothetical protein n=1 Tax=Nocardia sp. NPDC058633 TaxID=3346568 RepID=UPI003658AA93
MKRSMIVGALVAVSLTGAGAASAQPAAARDVWGPLASGSAAMGSGHPIDNSDGFLGSVDTMDDFLGFVFGCTLLFTTFSAGSAPCGE